MAPGSRRRGPHGPPARLVLPLLCCALASSGAAAMALQSPRITALRIPAQPLGIGCSVSVTCEAESGLPELTLLYWLGNGSFVEQLQPHAAVREGTTLEEPTDSGVTLRRELRFSSLSAQDLQTNFTCVVLSPSGSDIRKLQWDPPAPPPTEGKGLG